MDHSTCDPIVCDIAAKLQEEFDKQKLCPKCGQSLPFKQYGQKCYECRKTEEKARWDALTIKQKLDELKARMDAAGPAIQAAWLHVPLGG